MGKENPAAFCEGYRRDEVIPNAQAFKKPKFVFPATATMATESELMKDTGGFKAPQRDSRYVTLAAGNRVGALRAGVATLIQKFGSGAGAQSAVAWREVPSPYSPIKKV